MEALTISQLNGMIKNTLAREYLLRNCLVTGTVTNFKRHSNGHYYFTLKDEKASIDVTIWSSVIKNKEYIKELENGLLVMVKGSVNFYEPWGRLSFNASDVFIEQKSPLQIAFEALKTELTALGYFDDHHKKNIPPLPTCIGMITSSSGAVMHDILNVARARNPLVQFKLFSVPVQGDKAGPQIARAIEVADDDRDVDLIIVARGGGSMEDLWCFNDRLVVEALYHCHTPTISAVGHETDFTLCDFAADIRGSTPSHAAELAVVPIRELYMEVEGKKNYLDTKIMGAIGEEKQKIMAIFNRKLGIPTLQYLQQRKNSIRSMSDKILHNLLVMMESEKKKITVLHERLELLNPVNIMVKGYSKTEVAGQSIQSSAALHKGDMVTIIYVDGKVVTEVQEIDHGHILKNV